MTSTPPAAQSPTASPSARSSPRTPLSIDLSNLPPLSTPAPPSNTLLITNLESLAIFHPASLATIRQYIANLVPDELHSFSPLRSLRRIVCSFYSTDAAIKVRQELDGTVFIGTNSPVSRSSAGAGDLQAVDKGQAGAKEHDSRARIYFGEPTPTDNAKQYLDKPDAGKLFFISPPPSPPVGWESRREEAPNTETHASDLQSALAKLGSKLHDGVSSSGADNDQVNDLEVKVNNAAVSGTGAEPSSANTTGPRSATRTRSSSLAIIYDPDAHATGNKEKLPAVTVEDTAYEGDEEVDGPRLDEGKKIIAHTSRPPVELMND